MLRGNGLGRIDNKEGFRPRPKRLGTCFIIENELQDTDNCHRQTPLARDYTTTDGLDNVQVSEAKKRT